MIWRASIMEFIGSFALTFASIKYLHPSQYTDWSSADAADKPMGVGEPSIEIEAAKMIFVLAFFTWAGVAVSGAHFNPMVTIAMFMAQKAEPITAIFYLLFQAAGAAGAGFLQLFLTSTLRSKLKPVPGSKFSTWHYYLPSVHPDINFVQAIILEGAASFIFVMVYLMMMADKRAPKGVNCFAVGCAYGLGYLTVGYLTGSCVNPYIYILTRIFKLEIGDILVYVIGPLAGTVGGGVVYRLFLKSPEDLLAGRGQPIRSIVI